MQRLLLPFLNIQSRLKNICQDAAVFAGLALEVQKQKRTEKSIRKVRHLSYCRLDYVEGNKRHLLAKTKKQTPFV